MEINALWDEIVKILMRQYGNQIEYPIRGTWPGTQGGPGTWPASDTSLSNYFDMYDPTAGDLRFARTAAAWSDPRHIPQGSFAWGPKQDAYMQRVLGTMGELGGDAQQAAFEHYVRGVGVPTNLPKMPEEWRQRFAAGLGRQYDPSSVVY